VSNFFTLVASLVLCWTRLLVWIVVPTRKTFSFVRRVVWHIFPVHVLCVVVVATFLLYCCDWLTLYLCLFSVHFFNESRLLLDCFTASLASFIMSSNGMPSFSRIFSLRRFDLHPLMICFRISSSVLVLNSHNNADFLKRTTKSSIDSCSFCLSWPNVKTLLSMFLIGLKCPSNACFNLTMLGHSKCL
jgi:hypothetical protein